MLDSNSNNFYEIRSSELHPNIREIKVDEINFFEEGGQCKGASEWFVAMYLHAKKTCPKVSLKALLIAITKEFENGVDFDAAILQKYQNKKLHEELLRELDICSEKINKCKTFSQTLISFGQMENVQEYGTNFLKEVAALEDGTYILVFEGTKDIPGHATVIIKEKEEYYFFDPNFGLIGTSMEGGINTEDVSWFFTISEQYFPTNLLIDFFNKSLDKLIGKLGSKKGKLVDDIITELRDEKLLGKPYCLNAFENIALSNGLKKLFPNSYSYYDQDRHTIVNSQYENNIHGEKTDEYKIFKYLMVNPGMNLIEMTNVKRESFYFQKLFLHSS